MWLWMKWRCKLLYGWMVYTELAPRRQQFHVAQATQQPESVISTYTTSVDLKNTRYKKDTVTHSESHATCAQWVCSRAENSAVEKRWIIIIILAANVNGCVVRVVSASHRHWMSLVSTAIVVRLNSHSRASQLPYSCVSTPIVVRLNSHRVRQLQLSPDEHNQLISLIVNVMEFVTSKRGDNFDLNSLVPK